ncbi:MAG: amidohydrolase [Hydrocarboniphaga sp.]|uniref:amidohydrolase family protein n=1 Tax=Hydrocarboniphaga sp. TaxID=2033016 RepID=UPI002622FDD2|nr:amidohydrolase family protein [Hydrocarboniphaga sp.]MDB5969913.1 amidohydrolase [Hydrocarboniphaga sp.]
MTRPFIFSADSHIREPNDLFSKGLPASMQKWAVHAIKDGDTIVTKAGDQVIYKIRLNVVDLAGEKRIGAGEIKGRLLDMEKDGIDGEISFPSLGLWLYMITDAEAELGSCQIYNDWNSRFFAEHLDKFVRCGVLPVRDLNNTVAEIGRLAGMGFTAAMLPSVIPAGVPKYNSEAWDPVFAAACIAGIVLVMHTGTGLENVVQERGAGAAVINYTKQMNDGIDVVTYLVAGGVLDRNPGTQVAIIECGASWLAALSERMDEVYEAHSVFVKPKLSLPPSGIIRRQVHASFQHDRACIEARHILGTQAIMWASDYPHAEGTFPHSKDVITRLFEGIDISEQEKTDILGGNAARLFRLPRAAAAKA